ncbi:hypothetical protein HPP92_006610 [Vanilla planifolia]|uniref:Uncharacterized protein n=1 Tax=Vanilla planifolia TaxID=51239 RepID=A0A835RF44_VANPL|nr:hypothetical protein HPP92_006610 [Vanilla planifolia]
MAPLRVGIDLGASPLQVGGLVLGKYIVVNGSKDVKVNGEEAPSRVDVVQALKDARDCVKSFFGAPSYNSAVVVVPNSTSSRNREEILSIARGAGFNVVNVIDENIAVAYAYAEMVSRSTTKRIVIVSNTGGVLDVSVVSVSPDGKTIEVETHDSHHEPIDLKNWENESHKKHGPGVLGFVAGAVQEAIRVPFDILSAVLPGPKTGDVDELVFVGEASKSEKLRQEVQQRYPKATLTRTRRFTGDRGQNNLSLVMWTRVVPAVTCWTRWKSSWAIKQMF